MQICPNCNVQIYQDKLECPNCNWDLNFDICKSCGEKVNNESDYCDSCGYYMNREFLLLVNKELEFDEIIDNRYRVISPEEKIVKEIKPHVAKFFSKPLINPDLFNKYKRLSNFIATPKLHDAFSYDNNDFILLEILRDNYGQDLKSLQEMWSYITDKEKLYILKEWLDLFSSYYNEKVLGSILNFDNIFIDNENNLKLRILLTDEDEYSFDDKLKLLANLWFSLTVSNNMSEIEYVKYPIYKLIKSILDGKINDINLIKNNINELIEKPVVNLDYYADTNVGKKRKNNEDNFYSIILDIKEKSMNRVSNAKKGFYVVCDGMGGHEGGEIASASAISEMRKNILPVLNFDTNQEDIRNVLENSIISANKKIFEMNEKQSRTQEKRMGTTIVTSIIIDNKLFTCHVGDSRIYMIDQNSIQQITEDHNVAMKNYRDGVGSLDDAKRNATTPWGKVLTQALGPRSSENVYPEFNSLILKDDCYIILCSDGLTDMLTSEDIENIVKNYWNNPKDVVDNLIQAANSNGGRDNITVIAVKVDVFPNIFPPIEYSEIFLSNSIELNSDMIYMSDNTENSVNGVTVEIPE
jgi:protein phosphatase